MINVPSRFNRPWLWLPSQWAHDLAPSLFPLMMPFYPKVDRSWRAFQWRSLKFDNPMGLAGGVDKSGRVIEHWSKLGAGFVEVGTITPEPQGPNPGKIMARDISKRALWNKMGFPNPGAQALKNQLKRLSLSGTPLFVNIGKNRWTENDKAHVDYGICMETFKDLADVFVVNLSSPNTKGLRDLLDKDHLKAFLQGLDEKIKSINIKQPIVLKLSPDMDPEALNQTLEVSAEHVDGWILTNTTKQRYDDCPFDLDAGGVSGEPLKELSLKALEVAATFKKTCPEKLLVSVGGITSSEDIQTRLDMGADLVQCYSALVFEGPGFFASRLKELRGSN